MCVVPCSRRPSDRPPASASPEDHSPPGQQGWGGAHGIGSGSALVSTIRKVPSSTPPLKGFLQNTLREIRIVVQKIMIIMSTCELTSCISHRIARDLRQVRASYTYPSVCRLFQLAGAYVADIGGEDLNPPYLRRIPIQVPRWPSAASKYHSCSHSLVLSFSLTLSLGRPAIPMRHMSHEHTRVHASKCRKRF